MIYAFHGVPSDMNYTSIKLDNMTEMCLVIRPGVIEMLERLSQFCTLFAYSHGLKDYVLKILEKVDPEQKYFKERERRVLAPTDQIE